ncbi:MAG: ECF-type sigma factor [Planctomycetota bacterium]
MSDPTATTDDQAASDFLPATDRQIDRMVKRLTARARSVLWHCRRGVMDPHDAVMSTLRTYLRQAAEGEVVPPEDKDGLWGELERNLKRKLDKVRHSQGYKINRNTLRYSELENAEDGYLLDAALSGREPTSDEVETYIDRTMRSLEWRIDDPELYRVARMKIESYSTSEIAEATGKSEHQVRRRVSQIRRLLRADDADGGTDE